jgi:glyoxylase-like metal-dependent hydrolase (beta-lactamase superfamily II)
VQVSEHVQMLEVVGANGATHPALIHCKQELILVDAGFPGDIDPLKQAIQEAGFSPARLTYILLTHQDLDHIGCAKELVALSGAQVGAHELEAPYIQGDKTPVKLAAQEARFPSLSEQTRARVRAMRDAYDRRKLFVDLWLKDGERLPFCDGLTLIHTPGHTPGHACYHLPGDRTVIAGDALNVREDGRLTGPSPIYTANMALAVASLAKLAALDALHTVTYHGGLYEGSLGAAIAAL